MAARGVGGTVTSSDAPMSDEPKQPLPYERPAAPSVPRWQFRLLFMLVLVNLAVTLQTAYVPTVTRDVRQWWAERQERRRAQALYRQARDFAQPATNVAWEEDPDAAAKLLDGGTHQSVMVPTGFTRRLPFLSGWPPGAGATPPPAFPFLRGHLVPPEQSGFVFLRGRRSAGGLERLVYVLVEGQLTEEPSGLRLPPSVNNWALGSYGKAPGEPFESEVLKSLRLVATPWLPADGASPSRPVFNDATSLRVQPRGDGYWTVPWRWVPPDAGKPGQVVLERRDRFRFYAGQPDPKDPSAFTVDYELDGVRGRIRGRLRDNGRVSWEPEAGATIGSYWDPYATTARSGR